MRSSPDTGLDIDLDGLQAAFREALLSGDFSAVVPFVAGDGMPEEERLAVHRNNFIVSLSAVLADTFPALRRIVDPRFFAYAAHEFLTRHPPERACLAEYGGGFPAFLAGFAPCRDLPWLPDLARLEWVLSRSLNAPDAEPLTVAALGAFPSGAMPGLVLTLHPALFHIASSWPVERIRRCGLSGEAGPGAVAAEPVRLEVSREDGEVFLSRLDPGCFAFRAALGAGRTLEAAAGAALAEEPGFDLAAAIAALFADGAVVGVSF